MLTVKNIVLESFRIEASELDGRISLKLSGTADMGAIEPLAESLARVRLDMQRERLNAVVVDILVLAQFKLHQDVRAVHLSDSDGRPSVSR